MENILGEPNSNLTPSEAIKDMSFSTALFGILNTVLKPVLRALTLPIAFITLGLIWFAVAMAMLWLTSLFIDGFQIHGFGTLVWATIIVWAVNLVVDNVFHRQSHRRRAAATA